MPGLTRKEAGTGGRAGARAGPEAEIHGSETEKIVEDPEQTSRQQAGEDGAGLQERRASLEQGA